MKTYEARIRIDNGSFKTTTVQARDMLHAKQLLEDRYGVGKVTITNGSR